MIRPRSKYFCLIHDKDVLQAPPGNRQSNFFETFAGPEAGNGRVLVKKTDADDILTEDIVLLTIYPTGTEEGSTKEGILIPVAPIGYVTYSAGMDVEGKDSIVELIIRGTRWYQMHRSVRKAYNVQKQGFPYSVPPPPSTPQFYPSTLQGGTSEWTWEDVIEDLGPSKIGLVAGLTLPSWKPRNLVFDHVPESEVYRRIADQLMLVLGYDWALDKYILYNWGDTSTTNNNGDLKTEAPKLDVLRKAAKWGKASKPSDIDVAFKITGDESLADPFAQLSGLTETRYTLRNRPITDVGDTTSLWNVTLHHGYYVAIKQSPTALNVAELDPIADYIAQQLTAKFLLNPGEMLLPGIWAYDLDGKIRGIRWEFNANGYSTRVRTNTSVPFSTSIEDVLFQADRALGYADLFVEQTIDGAFLIGPGRGGAGVFPAKITAVNGSSQSTVYDAVACDDASISVVGEAPANHRVTTLDIFSAQVDDPCFIFLDCNGDPKIWLIETIDHGACPVQVSGGLGGMGGLQQYALGVQAKNVIYASQSQDTPTIMGRGK